MEKEYWFDFMELVGNKITEKNAKNIVWYLLDEFDEEVLENYSWMVEFVEELLQEEELNIEKMAEVLRILGYTIKYWTSRWYSQWDVAKCLMVLTDEIQNDIVDSNIENVMNEWAELFDAWAWGDTYWYKIVRLIPLYKEDGSLSTQVEEEEVDSCWGYYWDSGIKEIKGIAKDYVSDEAIDEACSNVIFSR
jgi:hypothetical protein